MRPDHVLEAATHDFGKRDLTLRGNALGLAVDLVGQLDLRTNHTSILHHHHSRATQSFFGFGSRKNATQKAAELGGNPPCAKTAGNLVLSAP
jgi:hypothetical protein